MATSIRETLRGRHVLVTGVTGFLGKVWLTMVLDHAPEIGRISVLIRSNRKGTAEERFWRIAERSPAFRPLRDKLGRAGFHAFVASKVRILDGDVGREHCGLDAETLVRVADEVDAVVHFAGLTDFEPDPLLGLATNTWGGENAADVAATLRVPRFLHVSTAFVAGNVSGRIAEAVTPGVSPNGTHFDPHRVAEELGHALQKLETKRDRIDLANERAVALGWPNIYTFTKGLSEHLHGLRDDLDLTIVRPAVVESSRAYPFAGWNEGINTSGPLVWLLSSWFRKFPSNPKHHFDVVPVDTVARGTLLVLAAKLRGEADDVYHFGSSSTNPLYFERAIDLTALGARRMHAKDEATPLDRFVTRFLDAVPRDANHDPFPSLPLLRKSAQKARDFLRDFSPKETLPPKLYEKWGANVEDKVKSLSMDCRNADRTLGRIEDMLRLYRPFIHDNDYIYETGRVMALTEALDDEERALFGFDIATLDWRDYWLNVHVPGLEKWSLPLLRNERVPEDPPFERVAPHAQSTGRARTPRSSTEGHVSGTFTLPGDVRGMDAGSGDVEPRHAVVQEERR